VYALPVRYHPSDTTVGGQMTELPFNVYRTRVRSHHTDLNGAMYHGHYFDIFDDARIETFRTLDCTYAQVVEERWLLVIRRVECEYFLPARMDEIVDVTVTIPRFTRATLSIRFDCRRDSDLLAIGCNTYVFLDERGRPTRMPQRLRDLIAATPEFEWGRD
jgi:acyl-CoA thioester hydrolase